MNERQELLNALLINPASMLPEMAVQFIGDLLINPLSEKRPDPQDIHQRNMDAIQAMASDGVVNRADEVEDNVPKIGILNIRGVIAKNDSYWYDIVGTKTLARQLKKLAQTENVKGIILHIESGGGEAMATHILKTAILEVRALGKKVVAYAEDLCASAAYDIASTCDEIWCNQKFCRVGSIGTYLTLQDVRIMYEKYGVILHEIYATDSTEKNKDVKDAFEGKYQNIRKNFIDPINKAFLGSVQTHRPNLNAKLTLKGKVFFYEDAKKHGLVDKIGTLEACGQSIFDNPHSHYVHSNLSQSHSTHSNTNLTENQIVSAVIETPKSTFYTSPQTPKDMSGLKNRFQNIVAYLGFVPSAEQPMEKADLDLLEQRISEVKSENEQLKASEQKKDTELTATKVAYDNAQKDWDTKQADFEEKIIGLEAKVTEQSETITQKEADLKEVTMQRNHNAEVIATYGNLPAEEPSQPQKTSGDDGATSQYKHPCEDPNRNYD